MFRQRQKNSFFDKLSGIASICSGTIICIRLAYYGILSAEWAGIIMVAVVVMVAIGNVATKLAICAVSVFLFAKYASHGNEVQFNGILEAIIALLIALIGIFIMIRGFFSR